MEADTVNLVLIAAVVLGTAVSDLVLTRRRPVVDASRPSRFVIALVAFGPLAASVAALLMLVTSSALDVPWLSLWIPAWLIVGSHCARIWWSLSRRRKA